MKEAYGLSIPETWQDFLTPKRTAIIIYDMQAGIVSQIEGGVGIVQGCKSLVHAAAAVGFRIFYTRHLFLPSAAAGIGQLRRSMVWQHKADPMDTKPFLTRTSPGFEIVSELTPLDSGVIIDKITMSAFEGTFLAIAMRDLHLDAFLIAGIALEVGIEPTIRHGLDLNFIPILISDLVGSKSQEERSRSLTTLRATGEVFVAGLDELLAHLRRKSSDE